MILGEEMELDEIDRTILEALQEDARASLSEIARQIDMSSATVHTRVSQLEDAGVIKGYHAKVDPKALDYGISAVVGLEITQGQEDDTLARLEEIPGVQEVHFTTGSWDVLMRVYAKDADELRELMFENVLQIDGFTRSQIMVILGTIYESEQLPVRVCE